MECRAPRSSRAAHPQSAQLVLTFWISPEPRRSAESDSMQHHRTCRGYWGRSPRPHRPRWAPCPPTGRPSSAWVQLRGLTADIGSSGTGRPSSSASRAACSAAARASGDGGRGSRPRRRRRRIRVPDARSRVREVLKRVDRLAVLADQEPEIGPWIAATTSSASWRSRPGGDAERGAHELEAPRDSAAAGVPGSLRGGARVAGGGARHSARSRARARSRRRAGPRSPSERTRNSTFLLSSPGKRRSSSRSAVHLASPTVSPVASTWSAPRGLAGSDRCPVAHRRVCGPLFFRRRTRCVRRRGAASAAGAAPCSPSAAAGPARRRRRRGGVRGSRFGSACGAGISRRSTSPWPIVQRFVVTQ